MPEVMDVDHLRAVAQAVRDFKSALERFLELHDFNSFLARGIAPAIFPKANAGEAEIAELRSRVSEAAGRAAGAVALTGTFLQISGVGSVDPIAAWSSMTGPKPVVEPNDVLDACGQIIGRLEMMSAHARSKASSSGGSGSMEGSAEASRPRVFIGSSAEGLPVAEALQVLLDRYCEVEIWDQGVFEPGGFSLGSLARAASTFDFAVLVVSPDDTTIMRGQQRNTARDNVIFELGLFMGALGSDRTFMVYDRSKRPDLPSDLAGVTAVTFAPHSSGDLEPSLGAASTKLRTAFRRIRPRASTAITPSQTFEQSASEDDDAPSMSNVESLASGELFRRLGNLHKTDRRGYGEAVRVLHSRGFDAARIASAAETSEASVRMIFRRASREPERRSTPGQRRGQ